MARLICPYQDVEPHDEMPAGMTVCTIHMVALVEVADDPAGTDPASGNPPSGASGGPGRPASGDSASGDLVTGGSASGDPASVVTAAPASGDGGGRGERLGEPPRAGTTPGDEGERSGVTGALPGAGRSARVAPGRTAEAGHAGSPAADRAPSGVPGYPAPPAIDQAESRGTAEPRGAADTQADVTRPVDAGPGSRAEPGVRTERGARAGPGSRAEPGVRGDRVTRVEPGAWAERKARIERDTRIEPGGRAGPGVGTADGEARCWHCGASAPDRRNTVCLECRRPLRAPALVVRFPDAPPVTLERGESTPLGRDPAICHFSAVFAPYENVSRNHAVLEVDDAGNAWVIARESAVNGTFVNDDEVMPGVPRQLQDDDCLRLAATIAGTVHLFREGPP